MKEMEKTTFEKETRAAEKWMQPKGLKAVKKGVWSGSIMHHEKWSAQCGADLRENNNKSPATTTWPTDYRYLLRKGESRGVLDSSLMECLSVMPLK